MVSREHSSFLINKDLTSRPAIEIMSSSAPAQPKKEEVGLAMLDEDDDFEEFEDGGMHVNQFSSPNHHRLQLMMIPRLNFNPLFFTRLV